ncbi:hypothetical protein JK636_03640 [Clostridium sp. YIM B02515]|uniref:Chromosome partition protein Smc n=1 Tax=Clostridium rhizosphaerae TaxID=2803861 RepID=A0ABS1T669_9CLOT|nr:hypothetical protein [Clostridium rhizosphaerae]MBL4934846.1 hypothetical protein [Clostridium rhizosphaerae]
MDEFNNETQDNKKDSPLSVRVEQYYKELFLELSEKPGYNRKRLLENMISTYISKEREDNRQSNLNLEHEISLISSSLNDILGVFKTISTKAQDTIGSDRSFYEQQIENYKKEIESYKMKFESEEVQIKELKLQNNELELVINKLNEENKKLEDKNKYLQQDADKAKDAHAAVLKDVYSLRGLEVENLRRTAENKELSAQIEAIKAIVNDKEKEIEKLKYNYNALEDKSDKKSELLEMQIEEMAKQIDRMRKDKEADIKELEELLRKEFQVRKETEILELKSEYNKLQLRYIKDMERIKK